MTKIEKIGSCVLYCGDAFTITGGLSEYHTIVTDPPYGMSFISNRRAMKHKAIANDENVECFDFVAGLEADHSKYVFGRWENLHDLLPPASVITWVKNNHSMGDLKHEHGRQTEQIFFYQGKNHFFPTRRPNDVIRADRTGNNLHPTQKPVGLMSAILTWTAGTVFDPFMGSGSTAVACAKYKRSFIGIEIDPEYFEIACRRVEEAYRQEDMFA